MAIGAIIEAVVQLAGELIGDEVARRIGFLGCLLIFLGLLAILVLVVFLLA